MITTSRQSSARAMRQQALVCELHTTAHRLDQLLLMPIFGEGNDFAEGQKEEEMDNITKTTNTPEEIRAYALQGYCLCERCDAIRRAELSPAELAMAMLPAFDISRRVAREG